MKFPHQSGTTPFGENALEDNGLHVAEGASLIPGRMTSQLLSLTNVIWLNFRLTVIATSSDTSL